MDIYGKNYKRNVIVIAVKRKECHLSTQRCNTKHTHDRSQVEHMNDIKCIRIKMVPQLQVSVDHVTIPGLRDGRVSKLRKTIAKSSICSVGMSSDELRYNLNYRHQNMLP